MQTETFIINGQEYTCIKMNAFEGNKLLLRAQKIALPVFGALFGAGKKFSETDISEAAKLISENVDEHIFENLILPLFDEAKVYCLKNKKTIKNGTDINQCFSIDNLYDLYTLIFLVMRYQFAPFFDSLVGRFGSLPSEEKA